MLFANNSTFSKSHKFHTYSEASQFCALLHVLLSTKLILPFQSLKLTGSTVTYTQARSSLCLPPSTFTSTSVLNIAERTLLIQQHLLPYGYTLIDARIDNYTIHQSSFVLIDLFSIVPLTSFAARSFIADFRASIILPCAIELYLGVPVRLLLTHTRYLSAIPHFVIGLLSLNINLFSHLYSLYIQTIFERFLLRLSPSFIDLFLSQADRNPTPSHARLLTNLDRQNTSLRKLTAFLKRKTFQDRSRWLRYTSFHSDTYNETKLSSVKQFLESLPPRSTLVDLGANTTLASFSEDYHIVPLDSDTAIANKLARYSPCTICSDLATLLVNPSCTSSNILSVNGSAHYALALGIFHHLVITEALPSDYLFKTFSHIYSHLLIEIPHPNDSLVKLLLRANPNITYFETTSYVKELTLHFSITKIHYVSATRTIYSLKSLH